MSPKTRGASGVSKSGRGKGKGKAVASSKQKPRFEEIPVEALNRPLTIGQPRVDRPVRETRGPPVFGRVVDESGTDTSTEIEEEQLVDPRRAKKARVDQPRVAETRVEGVPVEQTEAPTAEGDLPFKERFINDQAARVFKTRFMGRYILEREVDMDTVEVGFSANIKARKWEQFVTVPDFDERKPNLTLVREFMANLSAADLASGVVPVRKVKVPFTPQAIRDFYRLPVVESDYLDAIKAKTDKGEDPFEELRLAIDPTIPWTMKKSGVSTVRHMLKTTRFSRHWKVKARFVQNRLLPKDNFHKFILSDLAMLYALHFDIPIDVGQVLYSEITSGRHDQRAKLVCIHLIHGLCLAAGVPEYDVDEKHLKKPVLLSPLNEIAPIGRGEDDDDEVEGDGEPAPQDTTQPIEEPTIDVPSGPSVSTRIRLLIADGVRNLLDRQRVQLNTITIGLRALGRGIPDMPELPLD